VYRALERAGARLRNKAGRHDKLAAAAVACDDVAELHAHLDVTSFASVNQLLEDAWARVPAIAERYGVDPDALLASLDAYTRGLLVNSELHTIDRLADALPLGAVAA
jgi:NADP-dependent 3-hydroxy acid dehydrogenase YdfG